MKYTPSHEWIRVSQGIGTVGITKYAQQELGEVVYIQLPPIGKVVSMGDEVAVLESTKAAADIYSPAAGEIIEINEALRLLTDWPMAPENRAELDDTIWALQAFLDQTGIESAAIVLMDWDPNKKLQHVRERSMLHGKLVGGRPAEKQTIANIFQGESPGENGNYPGDSEMFIENTITIQVHLVKPMYESIPQPEVVALGLILPPNTKGFIVESANPFTRNNA